MTLTMTVFTPRRIYQSADYRLTDLVTKTSVDFETQKIALCSGEGWTASVAFSGVGRTPDVDVTEWLAERTKLFSGGLHRRFEDLVDSLTEADQWLSRIARRDLARHSFAIGAFIGARATFVLISNFETPTDLVSNVAGPGLVVYRVDPRKGRVFVSGQKPSVLRAEKRRLAALAARGGPPQQVHAALAEVNELAASRTSAVSAACFTTRIDVTGDAEGYPHGLEGRPFFPSFAIPEGLESVILDLVRQQYDLNALPAMGGLTMGRFDATDEYHEIQLRERPNDPNVHSNYGAYLADKKDDGVAAERKYTIALELDPNHVNALGNLGNLRWKQRRLDEAESLYQRALATDPGNANVTWNYGRFLVAQNESTRAAQVVDAGIAAHHDVGRLHLLRGEIHLLVRHPQEALKSVALAREHGSEQAATETLAAFATHLAGRPVGECVGAYRVALALSPEDAAVHLNLAQLLFVLGDDATALDELRHAVILGLDESARMEADFYRLAHTDETDDATRGIEARLSAGVRLDWDVRPNIETVRERDADFAETLAEIAAVMSGRGDVTVLRELIGRLRRRKEG